VIEKISGSLAIGSLAGASTFAVLTGLWYPLIVAGNREQRR
jgi:predicted outer membrane lipoprotein